MVYCVGNNNYDIFFENYRIMGSSPGGSMLNVAVSLGRMNVPVQLVTSLATDYLGELITEFLTQNGVSVDYADYSCKKKSSLALAVLNHEKKPTYSFYGDPEVFFTPKGATLKSSDILLFGSSYAIHPTTAPVVDEWIVRAAEAGALKVYDPNIRKKCAFQIEGAIAKAKERISQADIIKLSDEDLHAVGLTVEQMMQHYPDKFIILTRGAQPVWFIHQHKKSQIPAKQIMPHNTTGAGDAFNAGLLHIIAREKQPMASLQKASLAFWKGAIDSGNQAAALVCRSEENYVPKSKR
jgi:fructokinase